MSPGSSIPLTILAFFCFCAGGWAQVAVSGRVIDETGAGVAGARIEIRQVEGAAAAVGSSDRAGNFLLGAFPAGQYAVGVERQGFYVFRTSRQTLEGTSAQLTIILNHVQEFAEKVDVMASPTPIDPRQPAERKELDNTEI